MRDDPIALCVAGAISPPVAIARLLLAGVKPAVIAARLAALDHHVGSARAMQELLSERPEALDTLSAMVTGQKIDHDPSSRPPAQAMADIARLFDGAVSTAPEASVAFYSLNDPAILHAATDELVVWLAREGLLGPDRDVLDFGCGIGRVSAVLAGRCRKVRGVDISPNMIAEARRRHGELPNVSFGMARGDRLDEPENSVDLLLAVDVFPYLFQVGGGVARVHVADAGRILRAGGTLAILNLSYRDDARADRDALYCWAAASGMRPVCDAGRPFRLWDADAHLFRK